MNKVKTTTGQPIKKGKAKSKVIWIGGGAILLIGGGVAVWYFMKKKKEQKARKEIAAISAGSSRPRSSSGGGSWCKSYGYPLNYRTCHPDVGVLQRYLRSMGANLGRTGPNRDGVDNQFGQLTRTAAQQKLGKDSFGQSDIIGIKNSLKFVGK